MCDVVQHRIDRIAVHGLERRNPLPEQLGCAAAPRSAVSPSCKSVRLIHLVAGASIGTFVYSPWSSNPGFAALTRFGLIPL
jgi:hypothetical protein